MTVTLKHEPAVLLLLVLAFAALPAGAVHDLRRGGQSAAEEALKQGEGPIVTATVVVGPFDLHRKYKSMEGPYLRQRVRVSDLIASKSVVLPESMVKFVEGRSGAQAGSKFLPNKQPGYSQRPAGMVDTGGQKRELYWLKGIKVEVLDERDRAMPSAEFFCHMVVFVDPDFRNNIAFREAEPVNNERMLFLSQGLSDFYFPKGFAVPIASDENWVLSFQAANRTTSAHRRIKHRCTLYFLKDNQLRQPMQALNWYMPYVAVVQKESEANVCLAKGQNLDCMATTVGMCAPNSVPASTVYDSLGRKLAGHWVVPTGTHTYRYSLDIEPGLEDFAASERRVHAVWSHMHPFCTSSSLVDVTGKVRRKVFTATARTSSAKGIEIKHIDSVISQSGIPIEKGHHYELEGTYVNPTSSPQDSMINDGIFCADHKFVRPQWALGKK